MLQTCCRVLTCSVTFDRDFRIAVAAVHDGDTCEAVQVLLALTVIEVLHGATDELAGLLVEMT